MAQILTWAALIQRGCAAPILDTSRVVLLWFFVGLGVLAFALLRKPGDESRLPAIGATVVMSYAGAWILFLRATDYVAFPRWYPITYTRAVLISALILLLLSPVLRLQPRRAMAVLYGALVLWTGAVLAVPWESWVPTPRRQFAADLARLERGMTRAEVAAVMTAHPEATVSSIPWYAVVPMMTKRNAVSGNPTTDVAWVPAFAQTEPYWVARAAFNEKGHLVFLWWAGRSQLPPLEAGAVAGE